ncbi:MAG TPA: divalent cation tolerance protein CutA [Sphingomonadaceae bacterium]|nr:divalent cation tolerance protein CutA [Sphingomonadaceae bacterium]
MKAKAALIWSPFATEEDAAAAASLLLDEGLVACVNILPAMRSLYQWLGERGDTRECGALFKTEAGLLPRAIARLEEIHPYDAPAIVGWETDRCGAATSGWLGGLTGAGG